jgi:type II secretory pathway pseudopilin PulG
MNTVVSGQWSVVSGTGRGTCPAPRTKPRKGITLTEILIAIMILGIGLVSLATLFPIGLLRLREATRSSRSAYLTQSAAAEAASRGLLNPYSFSTADQVNGVGGRIWYPTSQAMVNNALVPWGYEPFIQDSPSYGGDPSALPLGAYAGDGGQELPGAILWNQPGVNKLHPIPGPGLPFAYDPLWRFRTGIFLDPIGQTTLEARFGSGIGFLRYNPGDNADASAHGLQRLTNFNPLMPISAVVPTVFVSPEDTVWQDPSNPYYTQAGNPNAPVGSAPSPVIPDLSISYTLDINGNKVPTYQSMTDWRFSWMFTGQLNNSSNASSLDGNIVIFENRPFGINLTGAAPFPPVGPYQSYQVDGETVVEAVFGYSNNVVSVVGAPGGYGSGADRTVLLRWSTLVPDPVVRPGDWIADITYERNQSVVHSRWWLGHVDANGVPFPLGVPNRTNNFEWDNLPPQRCHWYQVQKVTAPAVDPNLGNAFRSMVVYVNRSLVSRTLLDANGNPVIINAALIAPNVVNVIPQTIFNR